MSGGKLQRSVLALCASILMSSIFIGAAVAPSDVYASPIQVERYA